MAYIALYRKYRSQSFQELMGQEAVTTTLRNAVASGRFGHAYLFYGARGCGKTSTARLLARALNCVHGPTPDPCGVCPLCLAIKEGNCLDVIEMDAASETGIDDVREKVIENVAYAPAEGRYKVYIIDEAHDLSSKAFDALLKTLEEPPKHVVFVLATTEYHKVPITIRSRCQCFQFKRGTVQDLSASIERVAKAEGYEADPDAILAVARAAEGSWRDALSLLEQVMAYSDGHIGPETVQRAIGTAGPKELGQTVETLAKGDLQQIFELTSALLNTGTDAAQLLTALQGHLRDLALLAAGAVKAAEQEMGAERAALLQPQAELFRPALLLEMMGELAAAEKELRFSNHHRWIMERTLARLQETAQGRRSAAASAPSPAAASAPAQSAVKPQRESPPPASFTPTPVPKPPPPSSHTAPVEPEREEVPAAALSNNDRFAEDVSLEVIQRQWPRIMELIKKVSPPAWTYLNQAEVTGLETRTVVLSFKDAMMMERINKNTKGRDLIERKINEGLRSQGYLFRCVPASPTAPARPIPNGAAAQQDASHLFDADRPPAPVRNEEPEERPAAPQARSEFLTETLDIFGGEVIEES